LQLINDAGLPGPSLCLGSGGEIALIYQTRSPRIYVTLEIWAKLYYSAFVFEGDKHQYGSFPLDVLPQFVIDGIRESRK
jgi:hypothetical protein